MKKGMLVAEEVVKMVVAVICLSFLVYLLVSVYYSNTGSQNHERAQAVLNQIDEAVDKVLVSHDLFFNVTDVAPAGWNFFSFVSEDKKPNSCANENCLCICDGVMDDILIWHDRQINECDGDGICTIIPELKTFESFEIKSAGKGGTDVRISYDAGIRVTEI